MDLSIIYGDNREQLQKLLGKHGLFKLDKLNIMPVDENQTYIAGDFRVLQHTLLAAQHTLMYRFHNIVARELRKLNPKLADDRIFYETRRIVIACYQFIVYYGWLPLVIGIIRYKSICYLNREFS